MEINGVNFFKSETETVISFSGGRTSGMMLKLFIDAFYGVLPDHVKVIFANTGLEREETLEFVKECAERWNVEIIWLEYKKSDTPKERWQEVDFETASRNGEPFEALIEKKKYLPNPVKRFCTIELKIRVAKLYAQQVLGWKNWDNAVGFRADEPDRVAKLSLPNKEPFERFAPLASIGVTKHDVFNFWQQQTFDLNLSNNNGTTPHGNCQLCFLKGEQTTLGLISERPHIADWYIEMEKKMQSSNVAFNDGARFRKDRPSYEKLKEIAINQDDFIGFSDDAISCIGCTD